MNFAGTVQSSGERISYWLVPARPDKGRLQRIIFALANRFDAPRFEPHVTIFSGARTAEANEAEILAHATREIPEIVLHTIGVGHSQQFTQTLFLQFAPDERLRQLNHQLKQRSRGPSDYKLNPHLSLLYADLPAETKAALTRDLMYPLAIRFNVVKAIATGSRTQTREDIEAWRVIADRRLTRA